MYTRSNLRHGRGIADYENSGNWTWEHFPPPFTQWGPSNPAPQPSAFLGGGGLGCTSCGGGCGCPADTAGLGQTGIFGTGLFTGGPSTWGFGEWGTIAVVGYLGVKVLGSHPAIARGRKKAGSAASSGISGLGNIALIGALGYAAWWAYQTYGTQLGLGDYQPQGFATPQILQSPVSSRSSVLQIPSGW
jgi:hypothetical protein